MILTSSNRASWSLFQRKIRYFFSGAKPVSMAKVSSINGGRGGQSTSGGQSGKLMFVFGNQQKTKNFKKFGTNLG